VFSVKQALHMFFYTNFTYCYFSVITYFTVIWNNSNHSLGSFAKLGKASISFVMPVRFSASPIFHPSARDNSTPTKRIFMKFKMSIFENLSKKNQVRMHFSCRIPESTDALRMRNTLLFQCNNGYSNAPYYYIISTNTVILLLYNNKPKRFQKLLYKWDIMSACLCLSYKFLF
jgi:hypothetical protein